MAECYYSYSFDLDDGLITEENIGKNVLSPMRAVGCEPPIDFDDYVDVWKDLCFPIFKKGEEKKLTRRYFRKAYEQGEKEIVIDLEHNPLKNTYDAKYTRVDISLYKDEETEHGFAVVKWIDMSH